MPDQNCVGLVGFITIGAVTVPIAVMSAPAWKTICAPLLAHTSVPGAMVRLEPLLNVT